MKTRRGLIPLVLLPILFLVSCNPNSNQPAAPTSVPLSEPQDGSPPPPSDLIPPEHPVYLPPGFLVHVFADGLTNPRLMAIGPDGMLYVAEPTTGKIIRVPDRDGDGSGDGNEIAAEDLLFPSSLAFYKDGSMYVAETTRVIRLFDPDGDGYFQDRETIVAGFATGGNTDRTVIFSPDWKQFYLSYGSSCNVCDEQDKRRASVMRFGVDGSNPTIFTSGLRHVVGMDFNPGNDILWAANIERDGLGGNLPPDTLYAIYIDADAGWPFCHAGRITDPDFGSSNSCSEDLLTPRFELEAHSSPTGLAFYTGSQFPESYQNDLFVALHGSGEGSEAAGYKIVRIPLGEGEHGPVQDFAVDWLTEDGTPWGSPVDILVGPDGSLYISDDIGGIIYRIYYSKQ